MDAAAALRDALLAKLKSRTWRAGHRLPAERDLATQFGVSRSTVRRALQELKSRGLITQTVGSGTYVADGASAVLARQDSSSPAQAVSPAELMGARLVLEPAVIDMVIGNATAADFERMDACNDRAELASSVEEFEHWDGQLHEAIADAAHNGFIAGVFRLMNEVRSQAEWGQLKMRSATPARRLEYQQEHRELVAALKERDVDRARALCLTHLLRVRTNLLGH